MNDLEKKAVEIIKKIEYLNVSSITPEGLPWGSPVYTVYDKDVHFYWLSYKKNQHSINVLNNPNVFVTLYDSTVPCSTGVGVYLKGTVKMITDPIHLAKCLITFYNRRNRKPRDIKEFLTNYPRRLFMFTPDKAWLNGDGDINGNYIDIRTEIDIDEIKKGL
jgi:uncharacterized protein YhbP (UPF0306 family)